MATICKIQSATLQNTHDLVFRATSTTVTRDLLSTRRRSFTPSLFELALLCVFVFNSCVCVCVCVCSVCVCRGGGGEVREEEDHVRKFSFLVLEVRRSGFLVLSNWLRGSFVAKIYRKRNRYKSIYKAIVLRTVLLVNNYSSALVYVALSIAMR
jgi:hypothetical protein